MSARFKVTTKAGDVHEITVRESNGPKRGERMWIAKPADFVRFNASAESSASAHIAALRVCVLHRWEAISLAEVSP